MNSYKTKAVCGPDKLLSSFSIKKAPFQLRGFNTFGTIKLLNCKFPGGFIHSRIYISSHGIN